MLARLPNVRCYRVTNELDVVTRSRLNPSFKHLGHTIWLHHKRISPPKPFGHVPYRLRFGGLDVLPLCLPELCCCITSGVSDHGIDMYVDHLDGDSTRYSWEKYERRTLKDRRESARESELASMRARRQEEAVELHVGPAASGRRTQVTISDRRSVRRSLFSFGRAGSRASTTATNTNSHRRRWSLAEDLHMEAITQRIHTPSRGGDRESFI